MMEKLTYNTFDNKRLLRVVLLLILFFAGLNGFAQILPLDSVLKNIENNNPLLKKYEATIKAYNRYAEGARALDPPQVGAGFFMTPYDVSMWRGQGPHSTEPGMGSFMLSAQQMFFNSKKLRANESYMKGMSSVEQSMKEADKNELFNMAKQSYFELQVLYRKKSVYTELEELLNYMIKITELRYKYGMDKLNAYYKAKGMLFEMQQMKLMIETEISQMKIELNTLMNREKNISFEVDTTIIIKQYEADVIDSARISSRSDYAVFNRNIDLLKLKQSYEQSKRYPDFGIKYDHMIAFGSQPQQFSLMGMMSIPIVPWSSKMYKSASTGLNYEIEALKLQQQSFVNTVSGSLRNIQNQISNKKSQLALYENNILPSFRKNYQVTALAYENNTEELFMVLDALRNVKTAELGKLDLVSDLLRLQVEFEKELQIK